MDILSEDQLGEISLSELARNTGISLEDTIINMASLIQKDIYRGQLVLREWDNGDDDILYIPAPGETPLAILERMANYRRPAS